MIRNFRSIGCHTLMLKTWDCPHINVDLSLLSSYGKSSDDPRRSLKFLAGLRFCCRRMEELQNCRNASSGGRGLAIPISNAAFGFEPILEIVPVLGASRQKQLVSESGDIGIRGGGLASTPVACRLNRG
jgi:hypothetical protein